MDLWQYIENDSFAAYPVIEFCDPPFPKRPLPPGIGRQLCVEPFVKVGTGHRPGPDIGELLPKADLHLLTFYIAGHSRWKIRLVWWRGAGQLDPTKKWVFWWLCWGYSVNEITEQLGISPNLKESSGAFGLCPVGSVVLFSTAGGTPLRKLERR